MFIEYNSIKDVGLHKIEGIGDNIVSQYGMFVAPLSVMIGSNILGDRYSQSWHVLDGEKYEFLTPWLMFLPNDDCWT